MHSLKTQLGHRRTAGTQKASRVPMNSLIPAALLFCFVFVSVSFCRVAQAGEKVFRAGAAIRNITPKPGVSLDGIIMQIGPVKRIHDDLHVRALVFDDGVTRIAIAICDTCMLGQDVIDKAKAIVNRRTGLPANQMLIAAIHSHCAPRAMHAGTGPLDDEYHDILVKQIAESVVQAIENLAPASIGWGSINRPEYPFCRLWLMKPGTAGANPFGENSDQVKMTKPSDKNAIKPTGPVDPELFVLSVRHADGRPLALVGNYNIHYVGFEGGVASADYFGYFAGRSEELLKTTRGEPPFVGIMSNGTSGDTHCNSGSGNPFDRMKKVGYSLAEDAERLSKNMIYRSGISLTVANADLQLEVRRPDKARLAWAEATLAEAKKATGGRASSNPHIYAREAIHLGRFPQTVSVPLQVFRIGELAIVAIPCEVFAETGLAIKRSSPFPSTFTISLANSYAGYLPPPELHRLGGYSTWPCRGSFLEVQAEPKIRKAVLGLLKQASTQPSQGKTSGNAND